MLRAFFQSALVSALAMLLASCGGGSSAQAPPLPTTAATPASGSGGAPASGTRSITFTFAVPRAAASAARRPKYVSPNTGSIGVSVNAGPKTIANTSCGNGVCTATVTVAAPVQQVDTFLVIAYQGLNGTGAVLSQGSVSQAITAGSAIAVPIVLGGVVAAIQSVTLTNPPPASGVPSQGAVSITALDASGAVIVGCFASPASLQIYEGDPFTAFTFSAGLGPQSTALIGNSSGDAGACPFPDNVATPVLHYTGSVGDGTFPIAAIVVAAPTSNYLPGTAGTAMAELRGPACASGLPVCVVNPFDLGPFAPTAFAAPPIGEAGAAHVWASDNNSGRFGELFADGTYALYPADPAAVPPVALPAGSQPGGLIDLGGTVVSTEFSTPATDIFSIASATFATQPYAFGVGLQGDGASQSLSGQTPVVDASGNVWFIDPSTGQLGTFPRTNPSAITECVLQSLDTSPPVPLLGDVLVASGNTIWVSSTDDINGPGSHGYAYLAHFDASILGSPPCTIPYTSQQQLRKAFGSGVPVVAMAVDGAGNVWFDDGSQIGEATPNATLTKIAYHAVPTGVVPNGGMAYVAPYMYFVDGTASAVGRFSPAGFAAGVTEYKPPIPGFAVLQSTASLFSTDPLVANGSTLWTEASFTGVGPADFYTSEGGLGVRIDLATNPTFQSIARRPLSGVRTLPALKARRSARGRRSAARSPALPTVNFGR